MKNTLICEMDYADITSEPCDSKSQSKNGDHNSLPPDGGWGYAVCAGVGVVFMLGFGSSNAFGILFNDFFKTEGGASGLALVVGVYNGSLSVAGFLSGFALRQFKLRQVGMFGAILFVIGDISTVFVTSLHHLIISYGLIRGAGFGVMIPVSFTAFNLYFVRRRTSMMSISQTLSSLASLTFPLLTTNLLQEYGFRGSLAVIAALDFHVLAAMLVIQPVHWHYKKRSTFSKDCAVFIKSVQENDGDRQLADTSKEKSWRMKMFVFLELSLYTDYKYINITVGMALAFASDVSYLALEPMLLFSFGFTQVEVALCMMVGAATDLVARFLLAIYTNFVPTSNRLMFFIGTCLVIIFRTVLVQSRSWRWVCAASGAVGSARCFVQVLCPAVIADAMSPDRFAAAYSSYVLLVGITLLAGEPLIGVIYNSTGSYVLCFHALSACCVITVLFWSAEYFCKLYFTRRGNRKSIRVVRKFVVVEHTSPP